MTESQATGCKPPRGSERWLGWHWIYRPEDGTEIIDHWDGSQWRKQGAAIGWKYVRAATIREAEAANHG